jgi:hypothetical protein
MKGNNEPRKFVDPRDSRSYSDQLQYCRIRTHEGEDLLLSLAQRPGNNFGADEYGREWKLSGDGSLRMANDPSIAANLMPAPGTDAEAVKLIDKTKEAY